MFHRYVKLLFFIFPVIAANSLSAQELRYRSDMITRDNGLSNNSVTAVMKDAYGFIWIGTWNGLNRYDGYDMTVFQSDPVDSSTLSNSNINTLFEDSDSLLWIATDNGLNCYNQETGRFKRYYLVQNSLAEQRNNQVNKITEDVQGLIWVACQEGGLYSLNKHSGEIRQYLNGFSEGSNTIIDIHPDNLNEHYLWLGTADGLFSFNKTTGIFDRKYKGISEASFSIQVIRQDNTGNLFLGTWGNGLIKYNRKSSTLSYCDADIPGIRYSIIRAMLFDAKGNLIVNARDIGLVCYEISSGKISPWNTEELNSDFNSMLVTSMYREPSGTLWVGTIYDGVIKIVSLINSFKHYNTKTSQMDTRNGGGVTSILEDSDGFLWLGTRFGGMFKMDRRTGEYKIYNIANGLSSNNILSALEIHRGNNTEIWIGTEGGGLNCVNTATGKITIHKVKYGGNDVNSANSVSTMLQYDSSHLLIGTRDRNQGEGLYVFNINTGDFVNLRYNPFDTTSLSSNNIMKLFRDRLGVIWVGTRNGGLNKFVVRDINATVPAEMGYFIRYMNNPVDPGSLRNNTVYAIHDDTENNLWIGTNDGGLSKFNPSTGVFQNFMLNQYLVDHLIYGILADNQGSLWISTSRGIISMNMKTNEVHSFDKYDGLQESSFIYGSSYKSLAGEMFFGGIKGCNSFHPDSIRLNLRVPEIVITSFEFSGKKGTTEITDITGKSVLASRSVSTPYYQNNFSLSFSALDYQMPAKNRFRYKLDGYDQDWIETDARRRYVSYTNLPPGKYIFRVIGSNSDDIWNHKGTSVVINIKPPFWRTPVFYLLFFSLLLCAMIVVAYLVLRKYRLEKKRAELDALSAVQDERKQLRTLIDNIPDVIFIKDRDGRFTLANTKVALIMGTSAENLIGKTDFDFYQKDIAQGFFDDEQKIMETGVSMINFEESAHDEHGNRIIRSTTKVPIRNKEGMIIGIAGICRDITKLKNIEKQLRKKSEDLQETNRLLEGRQREMIIQSEELAEQTQNLLMINAELDRLNRTKDKFFSIIAHDLRNPFNAIIGFSELLRNDFHDMDNAQKLNVIELINVSSQTAYSLLENLLQWARTQTDKINFRPEDFDLSEMANAVIDLHCIIARKKGVKLKNQITKGTFVHADKNMISAVLRNLVSNAIKFTNPNGEIIISVNISVNDLSEMIEVHVKDDGIGMNRESLSKLFRIDTYYSTSGTMGESGTGLGLIICKEFIEKNNGRIRASSEEGSGTTMTFTLNPGKEPVADHNTITPAHL